MVIHVDISVIACFHSFPLQDATDYVHVHAHNYTVYMTALSVKPFAMIYTTC